ncbi:hypothetical protein G5T04_08510 [Lactobacillus salivarius]|uniref:hypothetical protein n=1 Tax=Ligilactobacillus salivarius TaxID=1624 RepID=UPI0013C9BF64|nr:hypothetical protein [Ligilactobacillus salivarius]NGG72708.1 hypothetical protein [Ligilactobacillus salivarius]
MRVKQMLLDDDGITYVIGETKFRYRVDQRPNIKVGQEVELVDLIRNTRPYLVMSKENQKK